MTKPDLQYYTLSLCTTGLGATDTSPGDPLLKHCFAKILDNSGKLLHTLSFGTHGVTRESFPNTPSTVCNKYPQQYTHEQINQLIHTFESKGAKPYKWGSNDCCSLLYESTQESLGLKDTTIAHATEVIRRSDNPFG